VEKFDSGGLPLTSPAAVSEANPLELLIIEDDPREALRIRCDLEAVEGARFGLSHASTAEDGLRAIEENSYDAVLLDLTLPDGSGSGVLARTRLAFAKVPIIVMADEDDRGLALEAVRLGAQGYLVKQRHDVRDLVLAIRHAVARHMHLAALREAKQREHYRATHDQLTGLYNRSALEDFMQRVLARAKRNASKIGVLFLDLDQFKPINDRWGHEIGDRLLAMVAQRMSAITREGNMVARVGGDEFVMILQDFDEDHIPGRVAEILVDILSAPFAIEGTQHVIGTSIGIALFPQDGDSASGLIGRADTAMYHAKAKGRNRYHYYTEGMDAVAAERLELESAVRSARSRGELLLHYQPVIDVSRNGKIVGSTAFLRWDRDERLLNAAEFLPVAQRIGVLDDISSWVVRTACKAAASWKLPESLEFYLAVKATHGQLQRRGVVDSIARSLREHDVPPGRIALEVRGCCGNDEQEGVMRTLESVRELGLRVVVEDFGAGCSALERLRRHEVDGVKIAPRLAQRVAEDDYDRSIVEALILVARKRSVDVIATGVETEEQRDALIDLGCTLLQGNLFASPAGSETMPGLIEAGRISLTALTE
jgi:diguanylate cyclase (GGDEF)-like protein